MMDFVNSRALTVGGTFLLMPLVEVSKNDEFCTFKNEKLCIKTRNCVFKMMNFADGESRGARVSGA